MNKSFFKIPICIFLVMVLFGGCAKTKEPVETSGTDATVITEEAVGETDKQPSTEDNTDEGIGEKTSETGTMVITEETVEETDEQPSTEYNTDAENNVGAMVSIRFPNEELLSQPQTFFEFIADDSEYQVKVELSTDVAVTDFRVLSLSIDNVTEEGTMVFNENVMYSSEKLTPEKPLVLGMVFVGDIPNMGISYVDANGMERVYAIALSGEDGQPLLVKAELTSYNSVLI